MKSSNGTNSKGRKLRRTEQLILFNVGAHRFAIAASAVHEIRSTDSLAGAAAELAQAELPKVQHMIHRGKRTYFVVHGGEHFQLPATRPTLVLVLRQSRVALLVDAIDRMATISRLYALPRAFAGDERQWYRGLALIEGRVVPVINPSGFLSEGDVQRLDEYAATAAEQNSAVEGSVAV